MLRRIREICCIYRLFPLIEKRLQGRVLAQILVVAILDKGLLVVGTARSLAQEIVVEVDQGDNQTEDAQSATDARGLEVIEKMYRLVESTVVVVEELVVGVEIVEQILLDVRPGLSKGIADVVQEHVEAVAHQTIGRLDALTDIVEHAGTHVLVRGPRDKSYEQQDDEHYCCNDYLTKATTKELAYYAWLLAVRAAIVLVHLMNA